MPKPQKIVRQDGAVRWKVRFRDGQTNASETFVDKRKANDFCKLVDALGGTRARAVINEHKRETVITMTLSDLLDRWFEWKSARQSDGKPLRVESPYTLVRYEQIIRLHIKPHLGHMQVNLVNQNDVQEWVDWLASERSRKTVADAHSLLHAVYTWANSKSRQLAIVDPCAETELPRKGKRVVKGIKPDEWRILHAAALEGDPDAADLLSFLVYTGWRWSESVAIRCMDVDDMGADGVWVNMGRVLRRVDGSRFEFADDDAKSQAGVRRVKLGGDAAAMVRRRMADLKPTDLLLTNSRGSGWHYSQFHSDVWTFSKLKTDGPGTRERILQAAHRLGLERAAEVKLHWLRHTHAALMVMQGESLAAVQKRLGHESIQTTIGTYGSMVTDVSDAGLDALDRLLSGGAPAVAAGTPALPDAESPAGS